MLDNMDEEDLRFTGLSGGKLVHEALVECGVDTVPTHPSHLNPPSVPLATLLLPTRSR